MNKSPIVFLMSLVGLAWCISSPVYAESNLAADSEAATILSTKALWKEKVT